MWPSQTLRVLSCSVNFMREATFVQALKDWRDPVGVVWIGLSLHTRTRREKLNVMRDVRRIIGGEGVFAVYEERESGRRGSRAIGTAGGICRSCIGPPTRRKHWDAIAVRPCV